MNLFFRLSSRETLEDKMMQDSYLLGTFLRYCNHYLICHDVIIIRTTKCIIIYHTRMWKYVALYVCLLRNVYNAMFTIIMFTISCLQCVVYNIVLQFLLLSVTYVILRHIPKQLIEPVFVLYNNNNKTLF